jgi:metallo-beta-lactamase family protein
MEMIDWLKNFEHKPIEIFLNHGELHQSDALRVKIQSELGWEAKIPKLDSEYILS